MSEKFVPADSPEQLSALFGQLDGNISRIQKDYGVTAVSRDGGIKLIGEESNVNDAEKALKALLRISGSGHALSEQTVRYVTSMVADGVEEELEELGGHLKAEHGFVINPLRTVFYGLCTDCADKKVKEDE